MNFSNKKQMKTKVKLLILSFIIIGNVKSIYCQDSLMTKFQNFTNKLYTKPVNYLNAKKYIKYFEFDFKNTNLEAFYLQASSTFYATVGKQNCAKQTYWDSKKINPDSVIFFNKDLTDYKKLLVETQSRQVVMINENHSFPEHRVFTTSLLVDFYNQGYRYLALEDLVNTDESLNSREHILESDGFYIKEIMFGEMIRVAKTIGFQLIPYDNNDEYDFSKRDSLGAKELKKVFKKNPKGKMIIHCGFGHIDKSIKSLAYYIQSETGINPFTISQVSTKPIAIREHKNPMILENEDFPNLFNIRSDVQIIHPIYNFKDRRPEYLFNNFRIKKSFSLNHLRLDYPVIIEVYNNEVFEGTVPVDRLIIDSKTFEINLSILKGEQILIIKNASNKIIHKELISG